MDGCDVRNVRTISIGSVLRPLIFKLFFRDSPPWGKFSRQDATSVAQKIRRGWM